MRIGLDIMGSETPPEVLIAAAHSVCPQLKPGDALVLYGEESQLVTLDRSLPQIQFVATGTSILMSDSPLEAVRRKTDSSMLHGLRDLSEKKLNAFITTGNTGALIAGATLLVRTLPGVDRPALLASLPTERGSVAVLDVGGNIACKIQHLIQFAYLGAAYVRSALGVKRPKVGLLNIGEEASKGTESVRQTYQALVDQFATDDTLDFVGNVEGKEVYRGAVDILLTDGFTGNIFLKASEGVSTFILEHLEAAFSEDQSPEVQAVLGGLRQKVDYSEYPGAIVCGVNGVLVKCHGESDQKAITNALKGAIRLVENEMIALLSKQLHG